MPSIRRGFPPGVLSAPVVCATAANAGIIASSSGSESRMPAPRRNSCGDERPVAVRDKGGRCSKAVSHGDAIHWQNAVKVELLFV